MVAFWQWMDIFRSTWKHRLVKNRGKEGVRCNLTFRLIRNHEQNCRLSSKWLNQTFLIFSIKWFQKGAFTFFKHAMLLKHWGWSFQSLCMTLKTNITCGVLNRAFFECKITNILTFLLKIVNFSILQLLRGGLKKARLRFSDTLCCWNFGDDYFKVHAWHWKLIYIRNMWCA